MAFTPNKTKIKHDQAQTKRAIKEKEKEFKLLGKKPFRVDPYGPGVVPQTFYDGLRAQDDPDYNRQSHKLLEDLNK